MVTDSAGDVLEVRDTHPAEFSTNESGTTIYCEGTKSLTLDSTYHMCAEIYAYDGELNSPVTGANQIAEKEYDACGVLVSTGTVSNSWHDVGKTYLTTPTYVAGPEAEISPIEQPNCMGSWKEVFTFTATFSDGETLSDTLEKPFTVEPVTIPPPATWGGGNPTELNSCQECAGDPVNTATGDYFDSATDLAFPDRGPDLIMKRTYSSLAAKAGQSSPLGRGWSFSYGMFLTLNSTTGDATITNPNGSQTEFESSAGAFTGPTRTLATLTQSEDGTYIYTVRDRLIYTFSKNGRLNSIADLDGNTINLEHNEAGQLTRASDSSGRSLTFTYEAGEVSKVTDSTGRFVRYAHTSSGLLAEVTDVRGGRWAYGYSAEGLLLTREDARGNIVMTNTYDGRGRVLSQVDGLKHKTTYHFPEPNSVMTSEMTDARGYSTEFEYHSGVLVRRTQGSNTSSPRATLYEHDPSTEGITALTDPDGNTTYTTYDSNGNRTSTTDALGNETHSVFDSLDDLVEYTDATGVTTANKYNLHGDLVSSSTPLVGSEPLQKRAVSYAYESGAYPGDVTSVTDPDGKVSTFAYDAAGDVVSATDGAGDKTSYTYDGRGNRVTKVSPEGNALGGTPSNWTTRYSYDASGNRLSVTDPLGNEREWSYDADNNLESETDANRNSTYYLYDADNQLIESKQPTGAVEESIYDASGNILTEVDARGSKTVRTYNAYDQVMSKTDPLGREWTYSYDGAGNLIDEGDPQSRSTVYSYDAGDELRGVGYSDGVTPSVNFGYDSDGRRTSVVDGTGESTCSFDSLGRLRTARNGNGSATAYGYDLAGNETSITYPTGETIVQGYDDAERLASIRDWLGNSTVFAYNRNSEQVSSTFPASTGNVDQYSRDRAGRVIGVKVKRASEVLTSLEYTRGKDGRVEEVRSEGLPGPESETFGYDSNDRLIKAGGSGYEYDLANNLTNGSGVLNTYDSAGQLETSGGAKVSFSPSGQRTGSGPGSPLYIRKFGGDLSGPGNLAKPEADAIDLEGNVWVADSGHRRVQEFGGKGEFLRQFSGSPEAPFGSYISGIAVNNSTHNVYVADGARIQEFNAKGEFIRKIGTPGSGNGQFSVLEGVAVDAEGHVWTVESGTKTRVQEFSSEGTYLGQFGSVGTATGKFEQPGGIAIDAGGNIWVADTFNNRIQELKPNGEFIRAVGAKGKANGQFNSPEDIAVDSEGKILVADSGNNRVQRFSSAGAYLSQFGTFGNNNSQLGDPSGLAVDSSGNVWVADTENNRIQEFAAGSQASNYAYDQAGNLTAVEMEGGGVSESYTYDGAGLRASQTVSGSKSYLTWNQTGRLPLLLNDGQDSYIYGPGGIPIEQISSAGVPTYYHHDQIGSTRLLTNSSGVATGTFSYGSFGTLSGRTGTQATPLGFAGQYTNLQSGLQYLRARVYDPATGQFLTADPLSSFTHEPYAYAGDDPLNRADPSGLCNANPFSGSFWTEGNCLSESPLNPIIYYEEEIRALECGASYWDAVSHGLEGAGVATLDVLVAAPLSDLAGSAAALDYWSEQFAIQYPDLFKYVIEQGVAPKPPYASLAAKAVYQYLRLHI